MDNPKTESINPERIEFPCGDVVFKGKVYRPANLDKCKGIVIFTHGLGYCDRQYKINGEYFTKKDYLLLTYNLRGHAGTPGQWSLQRSVEDLTHVINFLVQKYSFANNERICAIGHSTGALITLLAALKDKRIKLVSAVTTVTCLTDSYMHWFKSGFVNEVAGYFKEKGSVRPFIQEFLKSPNMLDRYRAGKIDSSEMLFSHRYGLLHSEKWSSFFDEIAYSPDLIKCAYEIKIPVLLFRGEYDEVMDVLKTNELYEKLDKKVPSKLYITKSKNHFHNDSWEMIQQETLKFFDAHCGEEPNHAVAHEKDILIIDDDPLVRNTLHNLMSRSGFKNIVTADGGVKGLESIAALRIAKNKGFDLVICDIRMPDMDGIETVRKLREVVGGASRENQVIFITGYEGGRTQLEAKELGYVDYLFKPFDLFEFMTSVKKHLGVR